MMDYHFTLKKCYNSLLILQTGMSDHFPIVPSKFQFHPTNVCQLLKNWCMKLPLVACLHAVGSPYAHCLLHIYVDMPNLCFIGIIL